MRPPKRYGLHAKSPAINVEQGFLLFDIGWLKLAYPDQLT